MKLQGDYVFNGPREVVYSVLRDVSILASAIPGETSVTQVNDHEYDGTIKLKIGPVNGQFGGHFSYEEEVVPESLKLVVAGKGAAGFAQGFGYVKLTEQPDNKTLFEYTGELNIGGKLASIGQRMIDSVSKSMIKGGLEKLDKEVAKRL
jgi:carbon monoxide dehydrogenase subunit G